MVDADEAKARQSGRGQKRALNGGLWPFAARVSDIVDASPTFPELPIACIQRGAAGTHRYEGPAGSASTGCRAAVGSRAWVLTRAVIPDVRTPLRRSGFGRDLVSRRQRDRSGLGPRFGGGRERRRASGLGLLRHWGGRPLRGAGGRQAGCVAADRRALFCCVSAGFQMGRAGRPDARAVTLTRSLAVCHWPRLRGRRAPVVDQCRC